MGLPTVHYCCCGCSLRFGTAIIFLFILVGNISALSVNTNLARKIAALVSIIIVLLALIAVFSNKSNLLIPYLIWCVIDIMLDLCQIIYVAVGGHGAAVDIISVDNKEINDMKELAIVVVIFSVIEFVVEFYFFIVVYSFYKELRGELSH